ncbi:MAG: LicD family protein [Selenomonadaceae bacterium]|nr:LicD family protein [Selenomonadaceae bacterium]
MSYVKNLYRDEIRDGWLVMSDIKKVWNRQLEIVAEVDRICRKHNITYWINYGTLIGAVRHKGFVPWDEDLDLCMMRPDYNLFLKVLDELNEPFQLKERLYGLLQISHSQTTMLDYTYLENKPQEIAIDIFALDIVDDKTPEGSSSYRALDELLTAACNYPKIIRYVQNGGRLLNDLQVLAAISKADEEQKLDILELYADALWGQSSLVAWIQDTLNKVAKPFRKDWFSETIYLPFETIELPAPKMFDEVLTAYYGDWRTPVHDGKNRMGNFHSADIPWREFSSRIDVPKFLEQMLSKTSAD